MAMGRGKGRGKNDKKDKDKKRGAKNLFRRKKFCRFTVEKIKQIDYKDVDLLKDFINENGKIIPARITGTKARYSLRCCRTPICTKRNAMQIILLEKVINLGQLGEVVKVREGYARNFLIPQGKAKRATQDNLAEFEQRRAELEKAQSDQHVAAQDKAGKLEGLMVQITQKAGVDGKLFGSVTNADISEALKKQGFDIPKAAIRMP